MSSEKNTAIKVFKFRLVILSVYGLIAIISFMQCLQFSIVCNIIVKFYNVERYWVDLTVIVFFVSFIVFFYPVSFLIEKYNLKFTMITATALTLAGILLKLLAAHPDRFWLILMSQFLISVGQVYLCSIPSKLATTWFGAEEVSTACAVAVLWIQLGSAVGSILSPFMVTNGSSSQVQSQLFNLFLYQAIAVVCAFVVVLGFFRSKPSLPPSHSQMNLTETNGGFDPNFFADMKKIAKNKNFWFIVFSLGLANGLWNSLGVMTNTVYLNFFPNGETDNGIISLITIFSGGCVGSMVFGVILDKTHHFKRTSFGILIATAISYIFVALSMVEKSRIGTFIAIPTFGFFVAPVLVVAFEYLVEVTYPIPASCSASLFNAAYNVLAILITLLYECLFDTIGVTYTFVVGFLILSSCAGIVLLVNSDLKRVDANSEENNTKNNITKEYINNISSTTAVTVDKF